jgi:SNF2 family DNA or RNA helicase
MNVIGKEYIWHNILDKICIRHCKIDVENQIKIYGYQERLVWLKFTDLERQLYESKKTKVCEQYLQQLCCHPLVVESTKKIFGNNTEVDLSLMQDKLIEFHKQNYETYTLKLSKLVNTNQAYHMLKKQYETIITESKYMLTILEKMTSEDNIEDNCSICLDCIDQPTLTICGHLFCYNCLKLCLDKNKLCPLCKTNLEGKDIIVINKKKDIIDNEDPLIQKYGSKLGKLISIIRHLVSQEETRIIIFSQWDDMLNLIGKTLANNGIDNCFVKGNVWARNSAIKKFKMGKTTDGTNNKVIMLSLKNAASGTNLTEATHIFFVEPINAPRDESRAIESQAIARACRVGQKQEIILSRILIENTIEEDIYRNYYNKDVIVSFEEQNFIINSKPIISKTKQSKKKLIEL